MDAVEFKISGRVQGVGYRYFAYRAALKLGILGWVKNMPDGTVLCQAIAEAGPMYAFREELRKGPTFGKVTELEETPLSPEVAVFTDFQITH